ncbi:MAG: peptidase [Candidatus Aminicenantes bacterium RBG_19FT_COMBO_58_17]|jgi:antitoxin MazE|nr:MAG: peptidase [Candidatus Aminicenantes bacterium RBG_19FT_COMBO_58_17]
MRRRIVPIGNSRGIRIPKAILEQCRIEDEVELQTEGDRIILSPVKRTVRQGWDQAFKKMRERSEDRLLVDERVDIAFKDWEW